MLVLETYLLYIASMDFSALENNVDIESCDSSSDSVKRDFMEPINYDSQGSGSDSQTDFGELLNK